jgi:WD40 repeat protein
VWESATGRLVAEMDGHGGLVNSAAFSPDGQRVVTASEDHTARVWEAASGQLVAELKGHRGTVNSAAFSPDGSRILTASDDGAARVWPMDSVEGDARILPIWVEVYTGTKLLQGGTVRVLTSEEWKNRCRQLKAAIQQGAKAPPSKWLDELLSEP